MRTNTLYKYDKQIKKINPKPLIKSMGSGYISLKVPAELRRQRNSSKFHQNDKSV